MTTYELTVEGMGCSSCVEKVDKILKEAGFKVLSCDLGNATIQSSMNPDALKKTIDSIMQDVGYMLVSLKAV
jgi:copper chaperone CopZ